MASIYGGVSNVARKLKGGFAGVGGVACKIKKGYVGVGGVARLVFSANSLPPKDTLENTSWADIGKVAAAGKAAEYWAVGDTKTITFPSAVLGSTSVSVEIIGFDHDDLADGSGKAPITFGMVDCFATKLAIDSASSSAAGGWPAMPIRATLQGSVYDAFPDDLKAVIKPVTKISSNKSRGGGTMVSAADTLFLLAEIEIQGAITYSWAGEGSRYARFATRTDRIKRIGTSTAYWHTRSPGHGTTSTDNWCRTQNDGVPGAAFVNMADGIGCAFCV